MKVSCWPLDDQRNLVFDQCDERSPIEQTLCFDLFERLGCLADPIGDKYAAGKIYLSAQRELGPYRVDFLIVAVARSTKQDLQLVIECDGAEFHQEPDDARDEWLGDRGFFVRHFLGTEIWMEPDRVLAWIAKKISEVVPVSVRPFDVPTKYLVPNCKALLPLLLRRGHETVPLLSLQSSVYAPPTTGVRAWLGVDRPLLGPANATLLISGTMREALALTSEDQALMMRARNSLIGGYLPTELSPDWLGYLRWREARQADRIALVSKQSPATQSTR